MGVPYFKIKEDLAKVNTAVFSSNFTLYRDISKRVMTVLKELVEEVDQYSIDEAFFIVRGSEESVAKQLAYLKSEVERRIGIPVSIGAAKTKTIAKIANHQAKASGQPYLLSDNNWIRLQASIGLHEVWGIGRKTSSKMRDHGLVTVADFLNTDRALVAQLFGVEGVRKWNELNEQSVYGMHERSNKLQQSIMSTRSFSQSVKKLSVIEDAINYHVTEAAKELRSLGAVAGAIEVHIRPSRHGDWSLRGGKIGVLLATPTNDTQTLLKTALGLTQQIWEQGVPYKKAGVILSMIKSTDSVQLDLFENDDRKSNGLSAVVDQLNQRFGPRSLNFGRLKNATGWQASITHLSPRYTTNWSELAKVKA